MENLPSFVFKNFETIEADLQNLLQENRDQIKKILMQNPKKWDDLLPKLMLLDNKLNLFWSPIQHLHHVADSKTLRCVYEACLPHITEYASELGQNKNLQLAYSRIAQSNEFEKLDYAQQKVIKNALRDFHLSGIDLSPSKKRQFREISTALAKLTMKFANNVLDATQSWQKHITDEKLLTGIPETTCQLAADLAKQENKMGWILTLDFPCYHAVMTYAENSALRQEIYTAYVTRASDQSTYSRWDNTQVMVKILKLRQQQAQLLNYRDYTQLSLATKMAESAQQVIQFLENLLQHSKPFALRDFNELKAFVSKNYQLDTLNAWDIPYYSEKLRVHTYNISQEALRPYFPVEHVLSGFFKILNRLYGITAKVFPQVETWHPDVTCYKLYDSQHNLRGICYIDLFARQNKQSGAWMDSYCQRFKLADGSIQTPVAYINCNFTPPTSEHPSLLTHDDIITLFHEFGHGLQHMLTLIDYADVSGIANVPWDAVELPSQLMENWCWQQPAIELISQHYQTGEPLPDAEFQNLLKAKNFQSGMAMIRQIEFALFDMKIHTNFDIEKGDDIQNILDSVRQQTSVIPIPIFNRFQHSFSHIFAGGYAAGYYSYLWAEVLSSDAFAKFEETGIFNRETGEEFLHTILEQGGAKEPLALFIEFRGREPRINALLRHSGFISPPCDS